MKDWVFYLVFDFSNYPFLIFFSESRMPRYIRKYHNEYTEAQIGGSVKYLSSKREILIGAPGYNLWDGK